MAQRESARKVRGATPTAETHDEMDNLTLEGCVRAFLDLAMVHPEKEPKTQRAARDNTMTIIGFNRAQETLRTILKVNGAASDIKALAEVRNDKQERPMKVGDLNVWVAG